MMSKLTLKRILSVGCIFLMVFVMCLLGGCSDDATEAVTDVADIVTTEADNYDILTDSVTEAAGESDSDSVDNDSLPTVLETYAPHKTYDVDSNEVSMNFAFGSAYSRYGGELRFTDDGTFNVYMGADGGEGSNTGTYTILSDDAIELSYANGFVDNAEILKVENGVVKEIKVSFGDIFFVVFKG